MSAGRFLLEIGTEELPASYQGPALEFLKTSLATFLEGHGLPSAGIEGWATPRRLAIRSSELPAAEPDREELIWGPPQSIAFDDAGKATAALTKFAQKQGIAPEALEPMARPGKGVYLCHRRMVVGGATAALLAEFSAGIVPSIPFAKSMRWGSGTLRFARPVRWLLALLGGETIPFTVDGLASGAITRGHRFLAPDPIRPSGAMEYEAAMEKAFVIVDADRRRAIVAEGTARLAAEIGGTPIIPDALLDEVVNLVEYPVPLRGVFDADFLAIPEEVLTTAMIHHQKYFPIKGPDGRLMASFVGISNMIASDPTVIVKGYQRVLRARLADARFFYREDRKAPLESRVEGLRDVVFHDRLGTSFAKMERFRALAVQLAAMVAPAKVAIVQRGAFLAKADLETSMVYEFPELQGIVGRIYSGEDGDDPEVSRGIEEHYLPRFAGDAVPRTDVGALVSIADRIDTLVGSFGIGQVPTGSEDPYALRRHALAILQILLDRGYRFPMRPMLTEAAALYGAVIKLSPDQASDQVWEFMLQRIRHFYRSRGIRPDLVDAVLAADVDDIVELDARMHAAAVMAQGRDLSAAGVPFKRMANITASHAGGEIDEKLFTSDAERELLAFHRGAREAIETAATAGDWVKAFSAIADYVAPVDRFFIDVLVMDPDPKIRANRLNLLRAISVFLRSLIDFSLLQETPQESSGTAQGG
jgi:glycyl-tRNA synthetase beta chain